MSTVSVILICIVAAVLASVLKQYNAVYSLLTVIAAAITSKMSKTHLPTHIDIYAEQVGLAKDSVVLLEQIRTIDKRRLKEKMGHLDDNIMNEVNSAIAVSFGLGVTAADEGGTVAI